LLSGSIIFLSETTVFIDYLWMHYFIHSIRNLTDMRKLSVLFILLFIALTSHAQQKVLFADSVDFTSGMPYYFLTDTTQSNNLWMTGAPSKPMFNAPWSPPSALMTDTAVLFPAGNKSSFTIQLHLDSLNQWMCIGNGFLHFRHRYDFDSLLAGGYIEIRYFESFSQQWTDWFNLVEDTLLLPWMNSLDPGEYPVDTIVGGIPAYTGKSAGWQYADFEWFWMMLVKGQDRDIYMGNLEIRFTALSDSSAVPTEGWMIDDMQIVLYQCFGNVEDLKAGEFLSKAYPNPGSGDVRIDIGEAQAEALNLQVFSREGALMESKLVQPGEQVIIQASRYPSGLYIYRLKAGNGKFSEGRFIKI
jgi:hypothetical protein